MQVLRLVLSAGLVCAASLLAAGCAAPQVAATPLPAPRPAPVLGATRVEACVAEGESCSGEASSCCNGLICAGINASICISRY